MIKILIVDDHPIVRRGLKQILSDEGDMMVIGEATKGEDALKFIKEREWDIVVLDISLPGRNGLEVLKEMKQIHPQLPILILSIHPEDQYAIRALKAGASGYLTKNSVPQELVKAIRKVLGGRKYITPATADKIINNLDKNARDQPHETLSNRELQVMIYVASGKTLREISKEMFLSPKTISTYRERILRKMQMKNNAQLIQYAITNKLLSNPF